VFFRQDFSLRFLPSLSLALPGLADWYFLIPFVSRFFLLWPTGVVLSLLVVLLALTLPFIRFLSHTFLPGLSSSGLSPTVHLSAFLSLSLLLLPFLRLLHLLSAHSLLSPHALTSSYFPAPGVVVPDFVPVSALPVASDLLSLADGSEFC
jgi:hypothetical protein